MKSYALCAGAGVLAFLLAGWQFGMFEPPVEGEGASTAVTPEKKAPAKPRAKFPQDLAPAARAEPVPQAADFNPKSKIHKTVVLKTTGALHDWQEYLPDEWLAERVEESELALIVGVPKKTQISIQTYPNGAPPIHRYRWELEVSVVEAKTGKVVGFQHFINEPRPIAKVEAWDRTAIGQPVAFRPVYEWLVSLAENDFAVATNPNPIVNIAQ